MRNADEETKYRHETNKFPRICRRAAEVDFAREGSHFGPASDAQSVCRSAAQSQARNHTQSLIAGFRTTATLPLILRLDIVTKPLPIKRPNLKKAIVRR